jgi:glycosyltransferase involved in cell wall biosynthesis
LAAGAIDGRSLCKFGESMTLNNEPLVTVLTPVYNGEEFLVECIESVLSQTYKNFEYIIVNNCSKDRTLEIAREYEKKDSRIRVHDNERFVPVIENHNIAFRLMSPTAQFCKIVSADDFIFPDCISKMVELAIANPAVGMVGCYQISGDKVRWQGFSYPQAVLSGRELCRQVFLGSDKTFGFGSPTSLLYRADLVRSTPEFYPNPSPHSDTSACFQHLRDCSYGFVFQTLCYERVHQATQSSKSGELNRYSSAGLNDLIQYGHYYLNDQEFAQVLDKHLKSYHQFLAVNYVFRFNDKEFWNYHKSRLAELGFPLSRISLLKSAMSELAQGALNPGQAISKLRKRI